MINHLINILKWPTALLAIVALPAIADEFLQVVRFIFAHKEYYRFFFIGLAVYWLVWYCLRGKNWGFLWFSTPEHEVTHALFAIASCNRVVYSLDSP